MTGLSDDFLFSSPRVKCLHGLPGHRLSDIQSEEKRGRRRRGKQRGTRRRNEGKRQGKEAGENEEKNKYGLVSDNILHNMHS